MTTRADLQAAVTGWVNRKNSTDFAQAFPSLLTLAEERIATSVRARSMVVRATYPVSGQYVPLPCDWLEFLDVRVQGKPYPLPLKARLDPVSLVGGGPSAYRLVDGQMEVLPAIDPASTNPPILEIAYYAAPVPLVLDTDTNALLDAHPSVYQFITTMFASLWIEDAELLTQFNDLAASAVAQANEWQNTSRWSGGRLNSTARCF